MALGEVAWERGFGRDCVVAVALGGDLVGKVREVQAETVQAPEATYHLGYQITKEC